MSESFLNKVAGLQLHSKRGSGTVFSCEFCEISKNNFFYRTPLVAASEIGCFHSVTFLFTYSHEKVFLTAH